MRSVRVRGPLIKSNVANIAAHYGHPFRTLAFLNKHFRMVETDHLRSGTSLLLPALPNGAVEYVPPEWAPPISTMAAKRAKTAAKRCAATAAHMAAAAACAAHVTLMVVDTPLYRMGQTVTVQPRTAPGFNFGGGEGRICRITPVSSVAQPPAQRQEKVATTQYLYDARFIIGSNTELSLIHI